MMMLCLTIKSTTGKPITFSYYSPSLHNSRTSDGGRYQRFASRGSYDRTYRSLSEKLRATALTCASNMHKNGTILKVSNPKNGKSIYVLVTDKMSTRFRNRRIDLSEEAIRLLSTNYRSQGLVKGTYEVYKEPKTNKR